ncbi:caspase recruitment domain-containing protein 14-like [Diretmus argenteus]
MAGECVPEGPDLKEMGEEELWELINDNRHRIALGVRPCMLIPYLRQARVLTEMDEDEIISCHNLHNRSMRTSHMLDLLRTQGRNGAVALLESLMIHYPTLYTQVTGRKPSTEPSRFSGLIKYSELTEYLIRAVTGMQKELQESRQEADRLSKRCTSLQSEISQMMEQKEKYRCLQADCEHMRRQLAAAHREVVKLKDEKCDLYVRYTASIEENSAVNIHCRDLNLQVYQLQTELRKAQTETDFQRQRSFRCASPAETQQLRDEVNSLRCQLLEAEKFAPAREDILAQDLVEARDGRTELVEQLMCYRDEKERLLREKEKLLDQKECLSLQVQQLTLDCDMYQQKSTVIQSQMRELQSERDQAYLSRDEAQALIARSLAEKDTLRSQLVELQERVFTVRARGSHMDTSGKQPHMD